MENIKLNNIKIGEKYIIKKIDLDGNIKRRIEELGFIKGSYIECVLKSPFKDPKAYFVKGSIVAIRDEISKNIYVERRQK